MILRKSFYKEIYRFKFDRSLGIPLKTRSVSTILDLETEQPTLSRRYLREKAISLYILAVSISS